jgi:hypothetical protein
MPASKTTAVTCATGGREVIPPPTYHYPNRSGLMRELYAHFKSRGAPESKWDQLYWRWVAQKGYRAAAKPATPAQPEEGK